MPAKESAHVLILQTDTVVSGDNVNDEHCRYKRMPFGLSNSPLSYMRLMNTTLHGLMGNTTNVFLDDMLIVSFQEARSSIFQTSRSRTKSQACKMQFPTGQSNIFRISD